MVITIFTYKYTPRVAYSFSLLFKHILKLEYCIEPDLSKAEYVTGPRLYYGPTPIPQIKLWLPASGLLFEAGIKADLKVSTGTFKGVTILFPVDSDDGILPFDLPGMAFYLVSRYEEYQPFQADHFGRFPAKESMAAKNDFLHEPIVNYWAIYLGRLLEELFPKLSIIYPNFSVRTSFDIDFAWAYRHRPWWRILAAGLRELLNGAWGTFKERLLVLMGRETDPFDVFDYLKQIHKDLQLDPVFFFLLGDYGTYDKNISAEVPEFQRLIAQLSDEYQVGIHPSFQSNQDDEQLSIEIQRLVKCTGELTRHSRQHFLMLEFPKTYHRLLEDGITDDYSMGFADDIGFRAGLASPFPWYDLSTEKEQPLMIHPFTLMDVSLQSYLGLSTTDALAKAQQLCEAVREVNGEFFILWHNSSFSSKHGWKGWREVFEKILSFATEIK